MLLIRRAGASLASFDSSSADLTLKKIVWGTIPRSERTNPALSDESVSRERDGSLWARCGQQTPTFHRLESLRVSCTSQLRDVVPHHAELEFVFWFHTKRTHLLELSVVPANDTSNQCRLIIRRGMLRIFHLLVCSHAGITRCAFHRRTGHPER